MKRCADWLVYFAVRVMICVVQILPIEVCQSWTQLLALLVTYVIPIRRSVIDENLRQAYPELTAFERRNLELRRRLERIRGKSNRAGSERLNLER